MTLLGSWSVLLARLSGQSDVVVGTAIANRPRRELESLIGFFANTLALRVRLEENPSVAQLLEQIKETTLAAYAHQDVPFEQVVEALRPERSLGHSPVFQTMLALNNAPGVAELTLPEVRLTRLPSPHHTTHFDLALWLSDHGPEVTGDLEYASDLFERDSVERMVGYWQTLLEGMLAQETVRIGALPLLSEAQCRQLLEQFNGRAVPDPQPQLMHELFEAQAAARPEAVALVYEAETLSYAELNRRANQVAHYLQAQGIRPGDRVALCLERSLGMMVGVLGVLKAAATYVPLDPGYPQERLAYMLHDSAPAAVLTQSQLTAGLPELSVPVVLLDSGGQAPSLATQPEFNPVPPPLADRAQQAAYIIYTSGSTGLPKGVVIPHGALANFLSSMALTPGLDASDRMVAVAPLSFDLAVNELHLPLVVGARIVLAARETALDGVALAKLLEQSAATAMAATPGTWRLLLAARW
jgi:non-ribosomal peptide synthetase component F